MHTIFENQYYLPQQMWVYLYNILLTVVANSFVLHSKQSKIKTILLQSVLFYLLLIPQHFDNMPSWTMQLSLLTIVTGNLLLYKDRFYVKIITSIVSILIIFLSDYLSYFIVAVLFGSSENYLQEPYVYLVSVTVITTLLGVYTIIGSRFLKKNRDMFFWQRQIRKYLCRIRCNSVKWVTPYSFVIMLQSGSPAGSSVSPPS